MAIFRETQNGSPRITSIVAAQQSSLFITLPSNQIWTSESHVSAGHTRCQRAVYELLARARLAHEEIESLCRSLLAVAAQAHALRDVEAVDMASQTVLGLSASDHAKKIARYYQAFCLSERREFATAREIVDHLLDERLSSQLRSRCLLIKGFTYFCAGQIDESLPFYLEAARAARNSDIAALLRAARHIAVIKSIHGDHYQASADLEALIPLACQIARNDPQAYSATLNSYAVELGEIGQVEQALNVVLRIAPFSIIHPEFNETIAELREKLPTRKHSVVVIHIPSEPATASQTAANRTTKRARLSTFIIREAERRFTSFRAPPLQRRRPIPSNLALLNPARQPAKPRAP